MKQFSAWTVLGAGGVDVAATVAKFQSDLEAAILTQDGTFTRVAAFVEEVLTANRGIRTNMDYVTGEVARRMGADATNHTEIKGAAADYIRANACGEKDGKPVDDKGNALSEPKRFFKGKGPGGGVSFWADRIADKAAKAAAAKK